MVWGQYDNIYQTLMPSQCYSSHLVVRNADKKKERIRILIKLIDDTQLYRLVVFLISPHGSSVFAWKQIYLMSRRFHRILFSINIFDDSVRGIFTFDFPVFDLGTLRTATVN